MAAAGTAVSKDASECAPHELTADRRRLCLPSRAVTASQPARRIGESRGQAAWNDMWNQWGQSVWFRSFLAIFRRLKPQVKIAVEVARLPSKLLSGSRRPSIVGW